MPQLLTRRLGRMGKILKFESGALATSSGLASRSQFFRRDAHHILRKATSDFFTDRIPAVSAAITFYALLALFPAITAFVSLYGLFASVHDAREHLAWLRGILPSRGIDVIGQDMIRLATLHAQKLGLAFLIGLVLSLWSANAGAGALIDGLNRAYEVKETRGYFMLTLRAFAFTLGALILAIAMFAFAALPFFASAFPPDIAAVLDVVRWFALVGLAFAALVIVYRFGPDGERASWAGVLPGAIVALSLWLAASALYSIYVENVADYDRTYGPLGAVIGFQMWIWLTIMVTLFGAELNAAAARRLTRET
jgi:membrane protein